MATIKKAFQPLHEALTALAPNTTLATVLADPTILKLMEASKGGFTGESNFIEIDGQKVARICAMTGAVFPHDNSDKETSFFYRNGSYMIGAEIVKANARKEWEATQASKEQELEDDMLAGELEPKEWKEAVTELKNEEFTFSLDDATKASLIADFDGILVEGDNDEETHKLSKEAFITAYNAGEIAPFTDYADKVKALREAGKSED